MKHVHKHIFANQSPFALCAVTSLIVGAGSIIGLVTDIFWVIGDINRDFAWYHIIVLLGLSAGLCVTLVSYIFLYRAIHNYLLKHEHRKINKKAKKKPKIIKSDLDLEVKEIYDDL